MTTPSFPKTVATLAGTVAAQAEAIDSLQAVDGVREITVATGAVLTTDVGGIICVNRGSGVTITVTDGVIPIGKEVEILQFGAGAVTIDPQGSLKLNGSTNNIVTAGAWTTVLLRAIKPNEIRAIVKAAS